MPLTRASGSTRVRLLALVAAGLFASLPAASLRAQLVGGVAVEESARVPLKALRVRLLRLSAAQDSAVVVDSARTDARGLFVFNAREPGVYQVSLGPPGHFYGPVDTLTSVDAVERTFLVGLRRLGAERPFCERETDKPASPIPGAGSPRYPTVERAAGVEGKVYVQFVVDTAGLVEIPTFRVLQATSSSFSEAVRDALPRMRFLPAEIGGVLVRQQVFMPLAFAMSMYEPRRGVNEPAPPRDEC